MHVHDGVPMTKIAKKYQIDISKLKYKVKIYSLYGETPFTDEQEKRIYSREEKLRAIQAVLKGEKSGRQVALELALPNADTVNDWVKLYKRKGESAIQVSKGRKKYLLHEERQAYLADKEIKARCKFLEDENEFLKKSLALALKKDKRLKRKYKSLMSLRAKSN
jgi:transposase-like protein